MKKNTGIALAATLLLMVALAAAAGCCWWMSRTSNPWGAKMVADIPAPIGFTRDTANGYGRFLRSLPLKKRGTQVRLFTGGTANYQFLSAAVVDIPVLSNAEQCADMTMRLRAEYLFSHKRYSDIAFTDVNGKRHRYGGGASRKAFEKYLKRMYGICSTYSVSKETSVRRASEVRPGDVLVYPARRGHKFGHAVLVADVATNAKGQKAILCIEGNTPAREAHVVRNLNPLRGPWFVIDDSDDAFAISCFHFNKDELRHY